jgi:23S rRNA pseudouridine1911/1915/1917 synthase
MGSDFKYKINNIPVVYEDEWLLIVDKPSGLLTIPTPKKEIRTLSSILNEEVKKKGISYRLHPCHRLDRETSGLIIYAKGKSIQKKIMEDFQKHKIKKIYIAFIQGIINQNNGQINKPVEGRYAITRFRVLERRSRFTVVEVTPLTGRKNQIRLHFKSIGHPIVGETRFVFRRDYELKAKRICLHAKSLELVHPVTQKTVRVDSKLDGYLEEFLRKNKN